MTSRPAETPPITVSIIEDDAPTRDLLAALLEKSDGFRCLSRHEDTRAALAELPAIAPAVVLVDINLPDLSGVECVRRLKPLMPATQFVMLTAYEDANHIFDALAAGATGYLVKRATREQLLAAIREVHAGGSPMAGNIARMVVQSFQKPALPTAPSATPPPLLSAREHQVLSLLAGGHLYKEIADTLGLSTPTVCTYIRRIYEKLHVRSRSQAVAAHFKLQAGASPAGNPDPGA